MAGYDQKQHLLQIGTILDSDAAEQRFEGDPLLLVKLDGVEAVSQLFAYDVIMLRDAGGREGQARPPLDTTRLIGTHAAIGARPADNSGVGHNEGQDIFYKRVGMFETFEDILDIDLTKLGPVHERDFHLYRGRVVPWVKVLSRDICYRIFENKTVVQIIDAIAEEAKKTFPNIKIDTSNLKNAQPAYTSIDYCCQFGESTLEFLSRLMARFGIRYYFGSNADSGAFVLNDVMVLKGNSDHQMPTAGISDVKVKTGDGPGIREIGKLVRRFRPPERRVAVGGFNYLDPTNPFYKDEAVASDDDLLKNEGGQALQTQFSGSTSFAQPVFTGADATALAEAATTQNQAEVLLLSGVTTNQTFVQGHSFRVEKFKNFDPNDNLNNSYDPVVDKNYVIDTLVITGNDYKYIVVEFLGAEKVLDLFINTIKQLQADSIDNTNNSLHNASLWVTETGRAKIYAAVNPVPESATNTASGLASDIAGVLGAAAGAIPGTLGSLLGGANFKQAVSDSANMATLAIGVIAVPADPPLDLPLPQAGRPTASGPHTAVVIGADDGQGVDDVKQSNDIYADALGRVRVRFPWDPGPPQGSSKIPPVFPFSQPQKPTKVGGNTAWVRVVEDWAGRHYGTQFLPRIGQEVLIEFLDGDPERPVITGRLYNADRGTSNIPFPDNSVKDTQVEKLADLPPTARFNLPYSGIKTWSMPTTDGSGSSLPARYHLLRFDDTRGKEQYLIRSQWRLDITAFQSRYETIHLDRHMTVGGKKEDGSGVEGDYITKIYRHYHLHVGDPDYPTQSGIRNTRIEQNDLLFVKKDTKLISGTWSGSTGDWYLHVGGSPNTGGKRTVIVEQSDNLQVNQDRNETINGNLATQVARQASLIANMTIVLSANTNISLVVGGSSIAITPASISITAPMVMINSGGSPASPSPPPPVVPADPQIDPPQDPTQADPGDKLTPPQS